MIWKANGIIDTDEWVRQFPATLCGVAIDWFADADPQNLTTWDNLKKEFTAEFQLLRDDNEIVAEIYNTRQGKNETVRVYARKLKDLINKMENKPADGLQKRWFVEGPQSKLRKKMKIVPPSSYIEAYNRAMDLESEQKTKKKKTSSSDSDNDEPSGEDSSDDEGSSKKVRNLQKDMIRMMKEFKNMHKETKGSELWCTECKINGHTKGSCPKNQFCDIC